MYDIRDPARWRRAYKVLNGYGRRVQYSVFRVRGPALMMARLGWELERILDDEDDLTIIELCPHCAQRVDIRGEDEGWADQEPTFEIVE